jgi:hypothetical protein
MRIKKAFACLNTPVLGCRLLLMLSRLIAVSPSVAAADHAVAGFLSQIEAFSAAA